MVASREKRTGNSYDNIHILGLPNTFLVSISCGMLHKQPSFITLNNLFKKNQSLCLMKDFWMGGN